MAFLCKILCNLLGKVDLSTTSLFLVLLQQVARDLGGEVGLEPARRAPEHSVEVLDLHQGRMNLISSSATQTVALKDNL